MSRSRRDFLAAVGRGTLTTTLGAGLATDLGLSGANAAENQEPSDRLTFGSMESLVRLMQETPAEKLMPVLVGKLRAGTDLRTLTAAGALANARTFGGEDYIGFHTMMALSPAFRMSAEMPPGRAALPVLKVLYRNTARIQETGGGKNEALHVVDGSGGPSGVAELHSAVHRKDVAAAERSLAQVAAQSAEAAFNAVLHPVQDQTEVHRVVMPYRAWDLLDVVGREHALTMLRQSVRYCVKAEGNTRPGPLSAPRTLLPKILEEHRLLDRTPGTRQADDAWVEQLSETFFRSTPEAAAGAAGAALAEGFAPDAIGEAIALAANQLVLRDYGRRPSEEWDGKPIGSVHGDSIGVHASDSANAWRNMARVGSPRNTFACLVLGAYQVALDRVQRGGDFLNWAALPHVYHKERVKTLDGPGVLKALDQAIRENMQARATALVHRYGELGLPDRPVFDMLLRYAVSEDGALHAEKFYRTVTEEYAVSRPRFKLRYLMGLARVTASEFGRPAPGMEEARRMLSA